MSTGDRRAIAELLREGLDDWVPLHNVIWQSREASSSSGDDFRKIVEAVVASVIAEGLMVAGDVGATGFEAWTGTPHELVARVVDQCREFDWKPMSAGCWFANTPEGDRLARAGSPTPGR